jgi:hypothetical protein
VRIVTKKKFVTVGREKYTNKDNEYTVTASDAIAGVGEILVSLDGSDFFNYSGPFKIQIPGEHTLGAKAVDNLGNVSSVDTVTFFVDVVPPETTLGTTLD